MTHGKPTGLTKDFIKWILTEGQQYLSEVGYIPLTEDQLQAELERLE